MYHELTDSFVVSSTLDRTWEFFSTADNLPMITPPWLRFTIDMPTGAWVTQDSVLDYTIRWMGIPIRWRTRIIDWSPMRQFIDLQLRGPYALWHHQHTFEEVAGGVLCRDRVIYRLPVPGMRRVAHALVVRRQLMEIFRFRRKVIGDRLGWVRANQADVEIGRL
jgi:ligand-binding SRPBCC domain-containing protein